MSITTRTSTTTAPGREWRSRAACLGTDPELFFPVADTGPIHDVQIAEAKAVCTSCPVVAECLAEALERIPDGIAGGLTADERRTLRRRDHRMITAARRAVVAAQRTGPEQVGGQAA